MGVDEPQIAQRPEYQQIQVALYKRATNKIGSDLSVKIMSTSDILGTEESPTRAIDLIL